MPQSAPASTAVGSRRVRRAIFMRPCGSPPSLMSVPLPAMLVAMVTAACWRGKVRGMPAWAMISASRLTAAGRALSTCAWMSLQSRKVRGRRREEPFPGCKPAHILASSRSHRSDSSTVCVPIRRGWDFRTDSYTKLTSLCSFAEYRPSTGLSTNTCIPQKGAERLLAHRGRPADYTVSLTSTG